MQRERYTQTDSRSGSIFAAEERRQKGGQQTLGRRKLLSHRLLLAELHMACSLTQAATALTRDTPRLTVCCFVPLLMCAVAEYQWLAWHGQGGYLNATPDPKTGKACQHCCCCCCVNVCSPLGSLYEVHSVCFEAQTLLTPWCTAAYPRCLPLLPPVCCSCCSPRIPACPPPPQSAASAILLLTAAAL